MIEEGISPVAAHIPCTAESPGSSQWRTILLFGPARARFLPGEAARFIKLCAEASSCKMVLIWNSRIGEKFRVTMALLIGMSECAKPRSPESRLRESDTPDRVDVPDGNGCIWRSSPMPLDRFSHWLEDMRRMFPRTEREGALREQGR